MSYGTSICIECGGMHPGKHDQYCSRFAADAEREASQRRIFDALVTVPPRPPEITPLPLARYGRADGMPVLFVPMSDGYWTPWHVAEHHVAALREALRELVACKDLNEEIMRLAGEPSGDGGLERYTAAQADYERRKPLAWAAARALLGGDE